MRVDVEVWRLGGPEPDCPALLEALSNSRTPRGDVIVFINSLGELVYEPATSVLLKMLIDDSLSQGDGNIIHALCGAVARLGCREAVPALMTLLDDARAVVRGAAARALGRLKVVAALEKLQQVVLDDEIVSVRLAAVAAATLIASSND